MIEDSQCSFCHRYHYEVLNLIASPEKGIYICSQCVEDFYPTPPEDVLYHPIKKKKKKTNSFFDMIEIFSIQIITFLTHSVHFVSAIIHFRHISSQITTILPSFVIVVWKYAEMFWTQRQKI